MWDLRTAALVGKLLDPRPQFGGVMADKELDARGLNCPLPILRAKKALNDMSSGQTLHIVATDPGSVKDFEAFARQTGNALLESNEANGEFTFLLKKA
jgi:tRNA 2-thiouridine synthesizing protein A